MYYCETCKKLFQEPKCSRCRAYDLREVTDDDFCYLCERDAMSADMLTEILSDRHIPCGRRSGTSAAAALYLGAHFETCKLYVPYRDLAAAQEIVTSLFSGEAEPVPSDAPTEDN